MKLSCLPVSFFSDIIGGTLSVGWWARQAKEAGFDGIDVSILFFRSCSREDLEAIGYDISRTGLPVAVVNVYPDFTHPGSGVREREYEQLQSDIVTAGLLGAEMIRVTAGQAHPETSRRSGVRWAVHGLRSSLETARRCGVRLVYENHSKPGVWQYPDFSHPTDIFLEIAAQLEGTDIGILFDTANPLAYGDDPVPLLKQVVDRVFCVHAADIASRGSLDPVLIGTGIVPFVDIFRALKGAGYDGWISIEEAGDLGMDGVRKAASFVRKVWEES